MAITAFAPAITRSKELLAEKSSKVALKLVPDISAGKQADRKLFAMIVSAIGIIGLLFLLILNTMLAQDAFKLSHLKYEVKMLSDEREAIARQIDNKSSPEALARAAMALGMRPSETPTFLNLDTPTLLPVSLRNG